ncbi:endonuclease-reverse transcriptase [Lasius niger]|uniref:Endonuclease-reverse transcriptase n=1 Tax=Lasius niger TaxID=67767 RepID=A0A0J7KB53_LASNI|nr:endonuclease-reverse transcriptase [Lasius niger]
MWLDTKHIIVLSLEMSQPAPKVTKKQHWMSDNTLALIEVRRKLKASGLDSREHLDKYNQLSRLIQTNCRSDKNDHLNNICSEIQHHVNITQPKDAFDKIKYITRKFKPRSWAVCDSNNNLNTNID